MDIIEKARELGKLIQQEESYIALQKAQADADADMELQNLIGDFNMKRMSINNEASKKIKTATSSHSLTARCERTTLRLCQTRI